MMHVNLREKGAKPGGRTGSGGKNDGNGGGVLAALFPLNQINVGPRVQLSSMKEGSLDPMMHVNLREKGAKRSGCTGSGGRDDGDVGGVLALWHVRPADLHTLREPLHRWGRGLGVFGVTGPQTCMPSNCINPVLSPSPTKLRQATAKEVMVAMCVVSVEKRK